MSYRQIWVLGAACFFANSASAQTFTAVTVPIPTASEPVQLEWVDSDKRSRNYVFLEPKYCTGGTPIKLTEMYFSGAKWPTYAQIAFCDGKMSFVAFGGMSYDQVRWEASEGSMKTNQGVSARIALPDIKYRLNLGAPSDNWEYNFWKERLNPRLRTAVNTSSASRPASANAASRESDLAASLVQAYGRAPRFQLGIGMGATTIQDNVMHINVMGMQREDYQFDVKPGAKCSPSTTGRVRCTYSFKFTVSLNLLGMSMPTQSTDWITRTDDFVKTDRIYRSASLDAAMLNAATPSNRKSSSATSSPSVSTPLPTLQDFNETMCLMGSVGYGKC